MRLAALASLLVTAALLATAARAGQPTGGTLPTGSGLPASWFLASRGPAGGRVWEGRIPDHFARWDHRPSAIYLPPGYDPTRSYPVIYLLHGMAGNPSSYVDSLKFAEVADGLIRSGKTKPFIAAIPVAGPVVDPNSGEWAGIWEQYVVNDVVPWVDQHLSTIRSPAGRALEGLCAGGFGAMDIGLRHPGMFGTLGAWDGYFAPVFHDGPFLGATPRALDAHTPALLVRHDASALRKDGVRFYVSVGGNHGAVLRVWSLHFAAELARLRLPHELWLLPTAQRGHFWSSTLPSALTYAASGLAA